LTIVARKATAVPIFVKYAYARPPRVMSGKCTGKRSPEVYAVGRIGRYALARSLLKANALTLVVWKKYALTLCVWKAYALALVVRKAFAVVGVVRTPYALTFCV